MAPPADATVLSTRRTRKSLGAHTDVRKVFEKENATIDVSRSLNAASRKKSRSKSLGPGGLDALNQASGNWRASIAASLKLPRSILKPTIPPLPEIPPLKKTKKDQTDLIDFGGTRDSSNTSKPSGSDSNGEKIALRTEEEQQAAAREREERERRDARRKSLANRRVSFAAEATLHTFHEVEYMQNAKASRRNSRGGRDPQPGQIPDDIELLDSQQNLQQKKRRRSSDKSSLNYESPEEEEATSTIYSSDSDSPDAIEEVEDQEEDEASSSDLEDGTMMSMDTEEVTGTTVASPSLGATGDQSSTLDEVLRLASQRAETQRLDEETSGGLDDGEEFIPLFGWGKNNSAPPSQQTAPPQSNEAELTQDGGSDEGADFDMEMTQAVGGIIKPSDEDTEAEPEEEISMDVTRAFGGIVQQKPPIENASDEDDAPMEEATMEFTTAIGGIQRPTADESNGTEDYEDMSMELTSVLGGVLSQNKRKSVGPSRRRTLNRRAADNNGEDATMDMTVGLGRIISNPTVAQDENQGNEASDKDANLDATMGMDMTTAIGGILNKVTASPRTMGKQIMEEEVDSPDITEEAVKAAVNQTSPSKHPAVEQVKASTPEPISPGLSAFHGKGLRRSLAPQTSTPKSSSKSKTPPPNPESTTPKSAPKPRTPTSTKTPVSTKRTTPRKRSTSPPKSTPKSKSQNSEPASATKLRDATSETATPSPSKSLQRRISLFQKDPATGNRTPTVSLTPKVRRLSGRGVDKTGLGSPRVTALFDRRSSIGETATEFVPGQRVVSFQDPQEIAEEVDQQRDNDHDKEDGRRILEREVDGIADDREATVNLREMISSMSPKRNPLKGRKSLHVGSARGLLGKRPNELDSDEEAEENDGVKRLKGHQGSPVKNVRLQQPPSKDETTGGLSTRSLRKSLAQSIANNSTPTLSSLAQGSSMRSPNPHGRFNDVQDDHTDRQVDFNASPAKSAEQLEREADEDKIHLQDFLNLTSIRFMELTTTKRRHTQAPGVFQNGFLADGTDDLLLERCVVAGACTVPMLELYQHSCRELKKYISEGRRIVKEIETETFEENPALFKEYMSATPEVKALMDNQFKNVKAHARLLSKAMWYEWRMKLQDGLKEGLLRIAEGMTEDEEVLRKQKELLSSVMPAAVARYQALIEESNSLEQAAEELADADPEELQAAREDLNVLDEDIEQKKKLIASLKAEFDEAEAEVQDLYSQKESCQNDIEEAEKIREECRGWTSTEVNALKARVDAIEKQHGWSLTGISGTTLSLAYRREIELVLDIAIFQKNKANCRVDLRYIADERGMDPVPKTTEKEFFLECIRQHTVVLVPNCAEVSTLIKAIGALWDKANLVSFQLRLVNGSFPTKVTETSDSSVAVETSLLLAPLETRIVITLNLHSVAGSEGPEISIVSDVKVIYGEHFNVGKVAEFLATRIGEQLGDCDENWSDILVELHDRLIARGKKVNG